MAEFTYNPLQLVQPGQPVVLNTTIPCPKGYVYHRNESGLVTLRGIVNNPSACFARYQVTFNGNIAVAPGGTVGPISVALAIEGEPILTSKAIANPAVVADPATPDVGFQNVTATAFITVPRGCCATVSVENTSAAATAAGAAPAINVQNANLTVTRIA